MYTGVQGRLLPGAARAWHGEQEAKRLASYSIMLPSIRRLASVRHSIGKNKKNCYIFRKNIHKKQKI
jgi:hypothetical protein